MDVLREIAVYMGFGIVFILIATLLVWAGALTVLLVRPHLGRCLGGRHERRRKGRFGAFPTLLLIRHGSTSPG